MSQNIFDNDVFFEKHRELRSIEYNYNNLIEQPAIKAFQIQKEKQFFIQDAGKDEFDRTTCIIIKGTKV